MAAIFRFGPRDHNISSEGKTDNDNFVTRDVTVAIITYTTPSFRIFVLGLFSYYVGLAALHNSLSQVTSVFKVELGRDKRTYMEY